MKGRRRDMSRVDPFWTQPVPSRNEESSWESSHSSNGVDSSWQRTRNSGRITKGGRKKDLTIKCALSFFFPNITLSYSFFTVPGEKSHSLVESSETLLSLYFFDRLTTQISNHSQIFLRRKKTRWKNKCQWSGKEQPSTMGKWAKRVGGMAMPEKNKLSTYTANKK